jgi:hypothetical protein
MRPVSRLTDSMWPGVVVLHGGHSREWRQGFFGERDEM